MLYIDQIGGVSLTDGEETFEWEIREFLSLSTKTGDYYDSPHFIFADTLWKLRLYPNGVTIFDEEKVGLYLVRGRSGPPKTIQYTLGIKGPKGVEKKEEFEYVFSEKEVGYGNSKFLSRSDLNNRRSSLMPNGVLTVTCCLSYSLGALKDTSPVSTDQAVKASIDQTVLNGEKNCLKSFLSMLESGADSDVIINVCGKEFQAHRNILRSRSDVFQSMFAHNMVEKNSGVVKMKDCDPTVFHDFLIHIYSGKCDQISAQNVCGLYAAADKYNVGDLREACSDFMRRNITVECFCDVITLSLKHSDKDLIDCATNFFCRNTVNIVKTATWQTFLAENPTAGNKLFLKAASKFTAQ